MAARCLPGRGGRPGYDNRRINKVYLAEKIGDFSRFCYLCGPEAFVEGVKEALAELGVRPDLLVFEA